MTTASRIIAFYKNLASDWNLPEGFELLYPFSNQYTINCIEIFYKKYFSDGEKRTIILGINPGRFGAGITGIPFTDPKILEELCSIQNPFKKKNELSAIFVYEFIDAYGGLEQFYNDFFISSVCPLGFIRNGINCNYYDDKTLFNSVKIYIVNELWNQINIGINRKVAFTLGKGTNFQYLKKLNQEHNFFEQIQPLPHPRWVMQYQRKNKEKHIQHIISKLKMA
jgi:uracil-DNA glycosylase